jgi:hypothetical protein
MAMAEQERRMAEQERRMAEQERKLAQQERAMVDTSRPQQLEPARTEYRHSPAQREEVSHQVAESIGPAARGNGGPGVLPPEDQGTEPASPAASQNGQHVWRDLAEEKPVVIPEGKKAAEPQPASPSRSQRASSIYDEYQELLEEAQEASEASPAGDTPPARLPLDLNLLSNLVYWVALAKQRVGEQQLQDILELYIKSGHSYPELRDLLLHVSDLVDATPVSVSQSAGEWMDLMFHLHGILTGGSPVVKIPRIRLPVPEDSAPDGS